MDVKHTPGEWTLDWQLDNGDKESRIYGDSENISEPIAIIPHDDIGLHAAEEIEANAKLIAAAPDLLAA